MAPFISMAGLPMLLLYVNFQIFIATELLNLDLYQYLNFPKFSDRYAWANSVDPDQTAPRGAV